MPRSVLVVDEDRDVARGLAAVFDGEGYAARYALDGLDALRLIRQCPPDLLVSDAILPGMSGVSLARRLRRSCRTAVILTSDFYADVDLPGVRFVRKPIDLDELLRMVRRLLGEVGEPSSPLVEITRSRATGRVAAGSGLPRPRGRPNQTVYK
jgi:DNA-binding response OmpR family regulator